MMEITHQRFNPRGETCGTLGEFLDCVCCFTFERKKVHALSSHLQQLRTQALPIVDRS